MQVPGAMQQQIENIYREQSRRVLATLIRLLGNFELAEEALQEAFSAALQQWPKEGIPANPRAWLVSTGRFKAIDQIRRRARFDASQQQLVQQLELAAGEPEVPPGFDIDDDQLRLIFTCCHPAIGEPARLAMTLREVCGLTTEEVARAFLAKPQTIAQRIVRAKTKIREAAIPYEIPERSQLPERLETVLGVLYLMFNEGYSASRGDMVVRGDLIGEAVRLARLLLQLLPPPQPEVQGLLALMLLHAARSAARTDAGGELVRLEDQDRQLWDRVRIAEGLQLVEQALGQPGFGSYALQAAIAAVHAQAASVEDTDWPQIVGLYDVLLRREPSPVIELNRAVAVAMRDGPAAGVAIIDSLLQQGCLTEYHLAHAALADLYRRLDEREAAVAAYRRALALAQQQPEQRFLAAQLAALEAQAGGPVADPDFAGATDRKPIGKPAE
ncbi:sigma-70 family RNA polymerase sigma factor [Kineobactrum salinum]|uniref:Sigma-70 family RNA polymerase sigma factor n=2 Tax=Kineobactrum salinum TaxID=2708301 RepID=A0A6C0U287_9GAMM|nr:sigma-70 family RNA polymerase sigma factor [Kineobactrum salinum]